MNIVNFSIVVNAASPILMAECRAKSRFISKKFGKVTIFIWQNCKKGSPQYFEPLSRKKNKIKLGHLFGRKFNVSYLCLIKIDLLLLLTT